MGRKLDAEPDGETLRCCSVNHSTFDYEGNKLSGPAKGPIQVYHSQEVDGNLVISLTDLTGTFRRSRQKSLLGAIWWRTPDVLVSLSEQRGAGRDRIMARNKDRVSEPRTLLASMRLLIH